jgi:hypothetical protein
MSPLLADFVAKLFSEPQHEISIQNRAPNRNIDSKACVDGFDYFKFQFHRLRLATFATKSARFDRSWQRSDTSGIRGKADMRRTSLKRR